MLHENIEKNISELIGMIESLNERCNQMQNTIDIYGKLIERLELQFDNHKRFENHD
jgi:chromosomal replication initiation ATPase DnaA